MEYYEYKIVKVKEAAYPSSQLTMMDKMQKIFNELGKDGWELVNFIESSSYAVFKKKNTSN